MGASVRRDGEGPTSRGGERGRGPIRWAGGPVGLGRARFTARGDPRREGVRVAGGASRTRRAALATRQRGPAAARTARLGRARRRLEVEGPPCAADALRRVPCSAGEPRGVLVAVRETSTDALDFAHSVLGRSHDLDRGRAGHGRAPRGNSRIEINPRRRQPDVRSQVRARASHVGTARSSAHPSKHAADVHGSSFSVTTAPCRRELPKT